MYNFGERTLAMNILKLSQLNGFLNSYNEICTLPASTLIKEEIFILLSTVTIIIIIILH